SLDLSALIHFSAGGQLLHPSEVNSSMSEFCVSPLSNVVTGGVEPGCSANKLELPISRAITRARIDFIFVDLKNNRGSAPGYNRSSSGDGCHRFLVGSLRAHPLQQMITDSQCVGNDCECWIHRAARTEKAGIDNVEIVKFVSFAIAIERAGLRIVAKADRPVLVRNTSERDTLAEEQVTGEETLV